MANTTKNDAQLRVDLLGLAISMLEGRADSALENEEEEAPPPSFTAEEVVDEAEKLYRFVLGKN